MILEILILILAFPIGIALAHFTKEELKDGKKYFKVIIFVSLISSIFFYFNNKIHLTLTSLFILIVTSISKYKTIKN